MAEGNGLIVKGKNIDIREAENRVYSDDYYSKKKSGILVVVLGTFGSQNKPQKVTKLSFMRKGSQVGSLTVILTMIAEKHLYSNCEYGECNQRRRCEYSGEKSSILKLQMTNMKPIPNKNLSKKV